MKSVKKKVSLAALIPIIYYAVSGGPYGLEELVSTVGPFYSLALILIIPIVWSIPEALIVGELAANFPVQGGYYKWVQKGLGPFWGFMEGWLSILYTLIDLSIYPILFTTYLKILLPFSLTSFQLYFIQLSIIWISVFINIIGINPVGKILSVFQVFITLTLIFFVLYALSYSQCNFTPAFIKPVEVSNKDILFGLSLAYWNYYGLDGASSVLGEIENPRKNYFKGVIITLPIIVALYFFPVFAGICVNPDWKSWELGELTFISNHMGIPLIGALVAIGGMIMAYGLFKSLMLTSTRIISTMAEDKMLPSILGKQHNKYKTPYIAIVISGVVYSALVLVGFESLVIYDVFLFLLAMLLEAVALYVLRNKRKDFIPLIPFGKWGFRVVFLVAVLNIAFMTMVYFFFYYNSIIKFLLAIALIFSAVPAYFCRKKYC